MYTIKNDVTSIEIYFSEVKETVWIRLSIGAGLRAYRESSTPAAPGAPLLSSMFAKQVLAPLLDEEAVAMAARLSAWVDIRFHDDMMELTMRRALVPGDIAVWERRIFMALASLTEARVYEMCALPGAAEKRQGAVEAVDHIICSFRV